MTLRPRNAGHWLMLAALMLFAMALILNALLKL